MHRMTVAALLLGLAVSPMALGQQRDDERRDESRSTQRREDTRRREDMRREDMRRDAARREDMQRRDRQRDEQARRQRRPLRGQVTGEVVKTKRVSVRGSDRQHLIVLLKTDRGHRVPVDLGDVNRLRQRPQEGDRVRVGGRVVQIGDRRVLIGEQLGAGGRMVRIQQPSRDQFVSERDRAGRRSPRSDQPTRRDSRQTSRDMRAGDRPAGLGIQTAYDENVDGVRVRRVIPDSPADRAGIRAGDVITNVEDQFVSSPRELVETITSQDPGQEVSITLRRDGQRRRVTADLTSRREALDGQQQRRQRERSQQRQTENFRRGADETY